MTESVSSRSRSTQTADPSIVTGASTLVTTAPFGTGRNDSSTCTPPSGAGRPDSPARDRAAPSAAPTG